MGMGGVEYITHYTFMTIICLGIGKTNLMDKNTLQKKTYQLVSYFTSKSNTAWKKEIVDRGSKIVDIERKSINH